MFLLPASIRLIINFLLFQACWMLAFLYQGEATWAMLILCLLLLFTHKKYCKQLTLLALSLPLGIGIEYLSVYSGLIAHPEGTVPFWLMILWMAFILTFDSSLKAIITLPNRLGTAVIGLFAPASYLAAANFGVFDILVPIIQFYVTFSVLWLVCTLFFIIIYDWLFTKSKFIA
ncbi:DUF2878 domain-containing protein [Pseudoalteromonas sp. JBTF-M23]|uniref:DUF2878 domain-containing protein n=1 Tax=Pseudoalteromonas caenipelagi TaxID=2726988 RepID=A0A849VBD6_9GAMM|nr:DUF2878 family protein [Pseudoalteromonas caenipelagi]NOU50315.1 DUF2878 domain-containing protein [Pseudoalteromonas caenipelagi]